MLQQISTLNLAVKVALGLVYLILFRILFFWRVVWLGFFSLAFLVLFWLVDQALSPPGIKPPCSQGWPRSCALVTGASSGFGYEFSRLLAADGHDLVLVARNEQRLGEIKEELESDYDVRIKIIAKDLTEDNAAHEVFEALQNDNLTVDLLINNAGIGLHGEFASLPLDRQLAVLNLNVMALTKLTHLFLEKTMQQREPRGKILNVASIAGYAPGPEMSVYFASKAFVISFTESLNFELRNTKVSASVVCPGAADTNFSTTAGYGSSIMFRYAPVMSARTVAEMSYRAWMQGETVIVPGLFNRLMTLGVPFVPRPLLLWACALLNKKV